MLFWCACIRFSVLCFAPLHAYAHIHRSPPVKICYLRCGDPQEALAQIRRIVEQSLVMGGTLQGLRHVWIHNLWKSRADKLLASLYCLESTEVFCRCALLAGCHFQGSPRLLNRGMKWAILHQWLPHLGHLATLFQVGGSKFKCRGFWPYVWLG